MAATVLIALFGFDIGFVVGLAAAILLHRKAAKSEVPRAEAPAPRTLTAEELTAMISAPQPRVSDIDWTSMPSTPVRTDFPWDHDPQYRGKVTVDFANRLVHVTDYDDPLNPTADVFPMHEWYARWGLPLDANVPHETVL